MKTHHQSISVFDPYEILEVETSASSSEITQAFARATKQRKHPVNVIAKARKQLMDSKSRLLADYHRPILNTPYRFKKTDLSILEMERPSLQILSDFDQLEEISKLSRLDTEFRAFLGKQLFSLDLIQDLNIESDYMDIENYSSQEIKKNCIDEEVEKILHEVEASLSETYPNYTNQNEFLSAGLQQSNFNKNMLIVLAISIGFLIPAALILLMITSLLNIDETDTRESSDSSMLEEMIQDSANFPVGQENPRGSTSNTHRQASSVKSREPFREVQPSPSRSRQTTCGNLDPGGTNTWYPVFVSYSEANLNRIRTEFCEDAFRKYRDSLGLHSIQAASFLNRSEAERFASLMRSQMGSGEVGLPTVHDFTNPEQ